MEFSKNQILSEKDLQRAAGVQSDLQPCPFCGCSNPLTWAEKNPETGIFVAKVLCRNNRCMAMIFNNSRDEKAARAGSLERWNGIGNRAEEASWEPELRTEWWALYGEDGELSHLMACQILELRPAGQVLVRLKPPCWAAKIQIPERALLRGAGLTEALTGILARAL